ncbi:MAG: SRPBCC family protein [Bacteroidales bacterium]|nr:SRPBCC family protein [Bacteroidales bacterium]MBR5029225.1 SRPBCC family protein [Bacteroidales bacterium]
MTIESKKTLINASAEKIYAFVSDFNNFSSMMPPQVEGWQTDGNTCSFKVSGFMQITLEMVERTPFSKVVVAPAAGSSSPMPFKMVIEMKEKDAATDTRIAFDIDANPMMVMMIKGKAKDALDMMADRLKYYIENQ